VCVCAAVSVCCKQATKHCLYMWGYVGGPAQHMQQGTKDSDGMQAPQLPGVEVEMKQNGQRGDDAGHIEQEQDQNDSEEDATHKSETGVAPEPEPEPEAQQPEPESELEPALVTTELPSVEAAAEQLGGDLPSDGSFGEEEDEDWYRALPVYLTPPCKMDTSYNAWWWKRIILLDTNGPT
jgi:hypothetical protein